MTQDTTTRFMRLFVGNSRSFGQYDPKTGRMWSLKRPYEAAEFEAHLRGKTGVGLVPILDEGPCRFGALDVDAHGSDATAIDVPALAARAAELDLPLVVCHSKSKGAHLYLFLKDPVPARTVRATLTKWASKLGLAGCEVFPKQTDLRADQTGERPLGNWINLPYFRGDSRVAVIGGREATLEYFLETAEAQSQTLDMLAGNAGGDEHADAPPCFQRMLVDGVPAGEGLRNRAVFHSAVYFKRAFPDDWKARAFDFNAKNLTEPLDYSEAKKTIDSVGKREYLYKCQEDPCASLCDRSTCMTRKYGIAAGESPDFPEFTEIRKFDTEPVKWEIVVGGKTLVTSTTELFVYRALRMRLMETLHIVPPLIKDREWEAKLRELMKDLQVLDVPDEASTAGFVRARLLEWAARAVDSDGEHGRFAIQRGSPIRVKIDGADMVAFRPTDFVDFLKRTRSEELKGVNLWVAVQPAGVCRRRLRLSPKVVIDCWMVPAPEATDDGPTPTYTSEL